MSLLSNAVNTLSTLVSRLGGETVLYKRNGVATALTTATPGSNNTKLAAIGVQQHSEVEFDWIIRAADLTLSGSRIEPEKGDVIEWTNQHGDAVSFKVLPDDFGRCFSYDDGAETSLVVHCKVTGRA